MDSCEIKKKLIFSHFMREERGHSLNETELNSNHANNTAPSAGTHALLGSREPCSSTSRALPFLTQFNSTHRLRPATLYSPCYHWQWLQHPAISNMLATDAYSRSLLVSLQGFWPWHMVPSLSLPPWSLQCWGSHHSWGCIFTDELFWPLRVASFSCYPRPCCVFKTS